MNGYALTLKSTGEASRALGNEQAACEQFSRARDLYRKLGYSQSNSSPVFAEMEKDCGHLRAAMSSGGPVVLLRRVDKPAAARHSLLGPYDLHRYPDLQVLFVCYLKTGRGNYLAYEDRTAIYKVGKMPMRPLISFVNHSVLSLFGHAHYHDASTGPEDAPALREHHRDFRRIE